MTESNDVTERLITCFQLVFPDLDTPAIVVADHGDLDEWDSLASISLVAVIEEEFNITIDDDAIQALTNFTAINALVAGALPA